MVTKEQLTAALDAWETAQRGALLEQQAWRTLTQSHGSLIASLRKYGHTWNEAQAEFQKISDAHRDALLGAWKSMDERCAEYQGLLAKFNAQT